MQVTAGLLPLTVMVYCVQDAAQSATIGNMVQWAAFVASLCLGHWCLLIEAAMGCQIVLGLYGVATS